MKKSKTIIGLVCAIGAAVCYGTNPLAQFLYAEGMKVPSSFFASHAFERKTKGKRDGSFRLALVFFWLLW